jgi:hypothetical protein
MHSPNVAGFVTAPTGLVYDALADLLYVASTQDNEIFAVPNAGTRTTDGGTGAVIYADQTHLHGPNAMVRAPGGHLLAAQSDLINGDPNQPSEIVEFTTSGKFVKQLSVDPAQGGAFGLNIRFFEGVAYFAAVDDNAPNISVWTLNRVF